MRIFALQLPNSNYSALEVYCIDNNTIPYITVHPMPNPYSPMDPGYILISNSILK